MAPRMADPKAPLPAPPGRLPDLLWRGATGLCALAIFAVLAATGAFLVRGSARAFAHHGFGFIFSDAWDPSGGHYGALAFLWGTAFTSVIALAVALPLGVLTAVWLVEIAPGWLRGPVGLIVEMLAAIPSVLLGLWGIFVLVPLVQKFQERVTAKFAGAPFIGRFFDGPPIGFGYLTAGLLVAIMILPVIVSVTREVLKTVPVIQREAAYGLGATRWEMIRLSVLPWGVQGIFGAGMLGLARALGETMAVTMVIGNTPQISASLHATGYTLASVIANEFAEAPDDLAISSLVSLGLILFLVTLVVNGAAQLMIRWLRKRAGGG